MTKRDIWNSVRINQNRLNGEGHLMTTQFEHNMDSAMAGNIGGKGIPALALDAGFVRTEKALDRLREEAKSGKLALLWLPGKFDDLDIIIEEAHRLREGASDIVILGTGGSSLGGQTLAQLADYHVPGLAALSKGPRMHFMDNLDPLSFEGLLGKLPLETTRIVAISKSGGTGETLMQCIAVLGAFEKAGLRHKVKDQVLGLSEPVKTGGRNGLRALLEPEGVRFLEHHTGIGGRYSGLTNVGLLPAAMMGLDIKALRQGALDAWEPIAEGLPAHASPAASGAALNIAAMMEGKSIAVLMPYTDRLERLTRWWVQLWAESLGKSGHGSQPVAALGPVDQHSQMQLYLAGPHDKLFTVISTSCAGLGPVMDKALCERAGEPDFAGKTIGDLVSAQGRATVETLAANGRPVRRIHIDQVDERSMGHLLMHFMLETIITGYGLAIDPFDQPAVEEGKILAKRYLAGQE
jgi:glucose-6-phosphate isomerase